MTLAQRQAVPNTGISWAQIPASPLRQNFGSMRSIVSPLERSWLPGVEKRLDELCRLNRNWNGYMAGPVVYTNAKFAQSMLEQICPSHVPPPFIAPGPDGDLQVEWHRPGVDIELHVHAPNDVTGWRRTAETGDDGEEIHFRVDFTIAARWVREMSEPAIAPRSAAA